MSKTKNKPKTKYRIRKERISALYWQELEKKEKLQKSSLLELESELKKNGFKAIVIGTKVEHWGTYVITPKINVKFLRILKDCNLTIDRNPPENSANNTLALQDMRKKPYTSRPKNKDFNIKLAIKYYARSWGSDAIGYGREEWFND